MLPCPTPLEAIQSRRSKHCIRLELPYTRKLASRRIRKDGLMPYSSTKQVSNIAGSTNQTQTNSHGQHLVPVAASHQLSQIDFYFISIPPHGSGAFPGASAVSSFLSSSLRPLFVRLVNARSWFCFPFAGPPAIPMVGAPGNTPEPRSHNEFR